MSGRGERGDSGNSDDFNHFNFWRSLPTYFTTFENQIAKMLEIVIKATRERNALRLEANNLRQQLIRERARYLQLNQQFQQFRRSIEFRDYDREDSGSDGGP